MKYLVYIAWILFLFVSIFSGSYYSPSLFFTLFIISAVLSIYAESKNFLDPRLLIFLITSIFVGGRIVSILVIDRFDEFSFQIDPNNFDVEKYKYVLFIISTGLLALFYGLNVKVSWYHKNSDNIFNQKRILGIDDECMYLTVNLLFVVQLFITFINLENFINLGYLNNYLNYTFSTYGVLSPFVDCYKYAVYFYLSVTASYKKAKYVLYAFIIISLIGSLSGGRGEYFPAILTILIYYFRHLNFKSIKNSQILLIGLFLIFLSQFISAYRDGGDLIINRTIFNFLYDQGNTYLTIYHSIYSELVKEYSFIYILSPIYEPILTSLRAMPAFLGNSIDYVMVTGNLAHILSYSVDPVGYLSGFGLGSSYFAEAYLAGGPIMIILISYLYGRFVVFVCDYRYISRYRALLFLTFYPYLLYAGRWNLLGFGASIIPILKVLFIYFLIFISKLAIVNDKNRIHN